MNTGQMMLTIAAMFLLTLVILTANRTFLSTSTTMYQSRYDIMGVSVATSIMEDAQGLSFDENTITQDITVVTPLTASTSLGLNTGESSADFKTFDDFDDYNSYKNSPKLDTVQIPGSSLKMFVNSYCRVDYVEAGNPNNVTSDKTFHKRMSIRVYAPGMADTVRMSTVYSYWFFR